MGLFDFLDNILGRTQPIFYNTLSLKKEVFRAKHGSKKVRMYNCGPTVYATQHIGNLSMFVFADILRRTLEYTGLEVKQTVNITDVGHLSSDADLGEDRMTLGLQREGLALTIENMRLLAEKYTTVFLADLAKLNINTKRVEFPRASDYIPEQIAMIKTLEKKGYAYKISDGVYFDTSRFPDYGRLGGINLTGLREGARVTASHEKRNPTDFILWKLDAHLGWDSPWGKGFPGWHIECSAMIRATLGTQIDIHTGGIEHIPIHHNNEIAQSESATGKAPLSRFWMHRAHIQIEGGKIAKSQGNVIYLSEILERGFHPLALRYLFLGAHYRTNSNFSWEALAAAQTAFAKLVALRLSISDSSGKVSRVWRKRFISHINDDLDTPGAIATLWDMTKDTHLEPCNLLATLLDFDQIMGLNLKEPDIQARTLSRVELRKEEIPADVRELLTQRAHAREKKDWQSADILRQKISKRGYTLDDTETDTRVSVTPPQQN